jgi:hypothetical protein
MPDERTALMGDDATNGGLFMFVADKARPVQRHPVRGQMDPAHGRQRRLGQALVDQAGQRHQR